MGKLTPGGADLAQNVVTGSIGSAVRAGAPFSPAPAGAFRQVATNAVTPSPFSIVIAGTFVGTVALIKSYDGGTTYVPASFSDSTRAVFTQVGAYPWEEGEPGVLYDLSMLVADGGAYTSGTATTRLSQ